jgi:hypothetical protein
MALQFWDVIIWVPQQADSVDQEMVDFCLQLCDAR